jgi:AbrB family looped-hinge helix DNA binding protein
MTRSIAVVSKGGQISIPAAVRRRWGTDRLVIDDEGDALIVRPIPADSIGAAIGSLAASGPTSDELRKRMREEEAQREGDRRSVS